MSETLPKPKFRDRAAFLLAGTLQTHANVDVPRTIPVQWGDFFALDVPEIHTSTVQYGVVVRGDEEAIDYMVAIEVPNFDGVNAPHTETIPAAHYAVFTINGLAHIGEHWMNICGSWMPTSGYKQAASPAFERYDDRYDPETKTGAIEIWMPVEKN
jgi:AraC family transcriptional regulator